LTIDLSIDSNGMNRLNIMTGWLVTVVFGVCCDTETDMVVHKECIEKARCVMGKKSSYL